MRLMGDNTLGDNNMKGWWRTRRKYDDGNKSLRHKGWETRWRDDGRQNDGRQGSKIVSKQDDWRTRFPRFQGFPLLVDMQRHTRQNHYWLMRGGTLTKVIVGWCTTAHEAKLLLVDAQVCILFQVCWVFHNGLRWFQGLHRFQGFHRFYRWVFRNFAGKCCTKTRPKDWNQALLFEYVCIDAGNTWKYDEIRSKSIQGPPGSLVWPKGQ